MTELGIAQDGGAVCFGQLLGMCDHVSLTLGKYPFFFYYVRNKQPINDVIGNELWWK